MVDVWQVKRVRLNSQGYTAEGSYFGTGAPLFAAMNDREYLNFRASDRNHAIAQLMNHSAWKHGDSPRLAAPMTCDDRHKPSHRDSQNRQFYTARGFLTRYALACGYVEVRGDNESGCRMELLSSGVFRVYGTGRWIRGEGATTHYSITNARRAFLTYDHYGLSKQIREAYEQEQRNIRYGVR